mgnify:CR=1 FL=1
MSLRLRLALRLLAWATWALPEDHPAQDAICHAALNILYSGENFSQKVLTNPENEV